MAYYVCSDLHGYPLDRFVSFLNRVGFCRDDFLYVLGDVIDRGPDGVRILKWLMRMPNAQLILGNHEVMMLGCDFLFETTLRAPSGRLKRRKMICYLNWIENSGQITIDELETLHDQEIRQIMDCLREAPLYETIRVNGKTYILTHAGLGNFRKNKKLSDYTEKELVWERPEIGQAYFENATVIFGHTPTFFYGEEYEGKAVTTPTWIDIDVGAGYGLRPMLLRLDDLQMFYDE